MKLNRKNKFITITIILLMICITIIGFFVYTIHNITYKVNDPNSLVYNKDITIQKTLLHKQEMYNIARNNNNIVRWGEDLGDVYIVVQVFEKIKDAKSYYNDLEIYPSKSLDWDERKIYKHNYDRILEPNKSDEDILFCNEFIQGRDENNCESWSYRSRYGNLIFQVNGGSGEGFTLDREEFAKLQKLFKDYFENQLDTLKK